ncbi:MAG TPA: phosphate signaling complex protein PhoU [Chryseosolibacter sp.]
MAAIEPELQVLKENLQDMLAMVKSQMENCIRAIAKRDTSIARQVLDEEKKINIQELAIDRDCENILALFTPVATDLRLVIASLRIANDLERIADSAKSLAKVLSEDPGKRHYKWMDDLKIPDMLEVLVSMLRDMGSALRDEDTKPALKAVKKDDTLNDYYKKAMKTTADLIIKNPDDSKSILSLFLMIRNLERSGDLTKNIAEEIVFQIEARVLKHQKLKKK